MRRISDSSVKNVGISAKKTNHKIGRYAEFLEENIRDKYEDFLSKDSYEVKDDIALAETRIADILQNVEGSLGGVDWKSVIYALQQVELAASTQRRGEYFQAIGNLVYVIRVAHSHYLAWHEIREFVDTKRRLVETSQKSVLLKTNFVEIDSVKQLLSKIENSIKEVLADELPEELYEKIIAKIIRAMRGE